MALTLFKSIVLSCIIGVVYCSVPSRNVKTTIFPDCHKYPKCLHAETRTNVVYTKASTKENDNLHYVFSTKELPTILLARTIGKDSNMLFDWNIILSDNTSLIDAITFDNPHTKVTYKFGLSFTKLIEYDDEHDNANLEDEKKNSTWHIRSFSNFTWLSVLEEETENSFTFNTTDDGLLPIHSNNGTMAFSFHIPSKDGRESEQPAQRYLVNETLLNFKLNDYTPSYKKSRFALEVVVVSSNNNKKMAVNTLKTIDDEFSPGVFLLTNWLTMADDNSRSGFVQWKPVCYLKADRGRKTSTKTKHYGLKDLEDEEELMTLNATFLSALFGKALHHGESDIKKMNISFGQAKDGAYVKTNYTVWSAAIGYGSPPKDEISLTVIIIISVGLGIPAIIMIFGGVFTIVKKMRGKRSGYEVISDHSSINNSRPQVN